MTCFWDGLRQGLKLNNSNKDFITYLQSNNKKVDTILWNNESLTKQQIDENYQHIKDFDMRYICNGYDCSICDPFLILITELYQVNINHNFNGYIMTYSKSNNTTTIYVSSNLEHFQFNSIK